MPRAYTDAMRNPPTRYAATNMCVASYGVALLKITRQGSTSTTLPAELRVKPCGSFIHELAATTEIVPPIPASTIGTPVQKCVHGLSRFQPCMYIAMKIASRKKNTPSAANGMPKAAPYLPMKLGQSRPNSKERTVPLTAPTANVTAMYFDQRSASISASLSSCLIAR